MLHRWVRHALEVIAGDGGQIAVMGVVVLTLFAASGFLVVDVGSWYGARREAQADADFVALADALELPSFEDDAGAVVNARDAATIWAIANGVDPPDLTVEVVNDCYSANDAVHTGVRVTVQREPKSYFVGLFPGIPTPSVSTVAVACSGTPQAMVGFMPWALELASTCFEDDPSDPSQRIPIYGARCDIVGGGGGGAPGSVGQLGFKDPGGCSDGDSGANAYEANIVTGVNRLCSVGDSVASNPGVNVGKTQSGLEARLSGEGACATATLPIFGPVVQPMTTQFNLHPTLQDLLNPTAGGIDDLFEVWGPGLGYDGVNSPAENLTPYDCDSTTVELETSPRNVVVIMIQDIGIGDSSGCTGVAGTMCYKIQGFARIYVEGCSTAAAGFQADCDVNGAGGSFTIHGRFIEATALSSSRIALSRYGDTLTFLKE